MDRQTRELLDFNKIKEEVLSYCFSREGAVIIEEQDFFREKEELSASLDKTCEFRMLLDVTEGLPAMDFPAMNFFKKIDKEGSVLEGPEAANLSRYIRSSMALSKYLKHIPENRDDYRALLVPEAELIPDLSPLADEISRNLDDQGNILENHPAIKPIKRVINRLTQDMRDISFKYLQSNKDYWQTDLPTQRDGRTVLPLKAHHRGKVKGIVHEVSAKGATVFIEPYEVVEKNNQLAVEENRLRQEELKILRELTRRIQEELDQCEILVGQIAFLDSIYSRARYSRVHKCSRPHLLERGIKLIEARHPGLGNQVVPINLAVDGETNILIITGPNTGGKTVSLKTAGLFVMMHQFGMEIPAREGSGLALFSGVYADIGDDQSIEESLSTFSGHMRRHSFIMDSADSESLVLLDELGGGTDPQEGAAIAMSILDWFANKGALVITTTHLGVMKNYGYTRKGAQNASVTFDDATLKPTYHIIPGIPGESHALEIASASGLAPEIIGAARDYVRGEKTDVSEMIQELQEGQIRIREQEKALKDSKRELNQLRRNVDLKELRLRQKEAEIRMDDYGELKKYIRNSRKELENLVASIKTGILDKQKTKSVREFVDDLTLKEGAEEEKRQELEMLLEEELSGESASDGAALKPADPDLFQEGIDVLVGPHKRNGTLIRKERGGKWLVAVGQMKMTFKEKDLIPVKGKKKKDTSYKLSVGKRGAYASMELDLRGMRLSEAISALEQHIDRAILSGLTVFHVIHGLGEGVLQKGVHDYLRSCPSVKKFDFAHPEQGGFGKTEVELG
ncbi:MAG: endonuclease MutS2 [Spirochaetales bacterium]|nr:endonuclease MutS2 [Spirochaetales bacterium]